jgi:hypothetical protein
VLRVALIVSILIDGLAKNYFQHAGLAGGRPILSELSIVTG